MPVSGNQRMFNDMAHHFTARQVHGIDLVPVCKQLARQDLIARLQSHTDVGEVMAELSKPEGDIKHHHAPQHGHGPTDPPHQQAIDQPTDQGGRRHRNQPYHPGALTLSHVQGAAHPSDPGTQTCLHPTLF